MIALAQRIMIRCVAALTRHFVPKGAPPPFIPRLSPDPSATNAVAAAEAGRGPIAYGRLMRGVQGK